MSLFYLGHRETYDQDELLGVDWHAPLGAEVFDSPEAARAWIESEEGYGGVPAGAFDVFRVEDVQVEEVEGRLVALAAARFLERVEE